MGNDQQTIWNKIWTRSDGTLSKKDHFTLMDEIKYDYLKPLLKGTGKAIEVGSGSGRLSTYFALSNYEVYLLDFSEEALRVAEKNFNSIGKKATYVQADVHHIPFEDGYFDVVFSTGVLEHFTDPLPIIIEMMRVLKPGGLFYSDIIPKKFSLIRSLDFIQRWQNKVEEWDEFAYSRKTIEQFCRDANMVNFKVFPFGVYPPRFLPYKGRFPRFLKFEAKILYSLKKFWMSLDNSLLAELIGFGYFVYGYKAQLSNNNTPVKI
jgi:ubiquinone/menaquinone biosynthesis C-methylase UbiE